MATLRELRTEQMAEALQGGAERSVPAIVTVGSGENLENLHSRVLGVADGHILIEQPASGELQMPKELTPAEKIGLTFKLKHYKYIFSAIVAGTQQFRLEDGTEMPVVSLCYPRRMQRLQRRAYIRTEVPSNHIVRASFWFGGQHAEPDGTTPDKPVWSGRVHNISAGGFQLTTAAEPADVLETGDLVGVHMTFGAADQTFCADAQLRHIESVDDGLSLGFQFIGLGHTFEGRAALRLLNAKITEYQRFAESR